MSTLREMREKFKNTFLQLNNSWKKEEIDCIRDKVSSWHISKKITDDEFKFLLDWINGRYELINF